MNTCTPTRLSRRLLCLAAMLTLTTPAQAATLNVPTTAYPTIQSAISAAQAGDTVLVADGTYTGPGNVDLAFSKSITVASVNGAAATVIDCQGSAAQPHRAFRLVLTQAAATIRGFTIKNGYAPEDGPNSGDPRYGGGIFAATTATVQDCVVTGCTAAGAGSQGGGLYVNAGAVLRVIVSDCQAGGGSGEGGGLYTSRAAVTGGSVTSCSAGGEGGGVYVGNQAATVSGLTVQGCTAGTLSTPGSGGGLYLGTGAAAANCTVVGCAAPGGQGGGIAAPSDATGVGMSPPPGTVRNCTLTANSAATGGAFYTYNTPALNCILWGDTATGSGPEFASGGGPPQVSYCDVSGGAAGAHNLSADPQFVRVPSPSASPADYGDLHLRATSPCLGAGVAVSGLATDKDGVTRPSPPSIGAYEYVAPAHSWTAMAVSAGADGYTRLLWTRADGTASVWKVDSAGSIVTQQQFGPYSGWTARAIATGGDNQTRLLWTSSNGTAAYYLLNANNVFVSQQQYGPYAGWTAQGVTAEPDDTLRALWTNTDGTATVWTLDATNHLTTQQQYGPYSGWTAKSLTVNPDGTERLLWDSADGTATFWHLTNGSQLIDQHQYGPYSGYTATSIAASPDGTGRVVWVGQDAHIALWTLDGNNIYTGQQSQYGPYVGWSFMGIGVGADGDARLLWDNVTGQAALWSLAPGGGFASNTQYGPY